MVFRVDGVSQERDETVTLKLVPSENFETHIPTGESVFFKNDLDVTILDNDSKQTSTLRTQFTEIISSNFHSFRDLPEPERIPFVRG